MCINTVALFMRRKGKPGPFIVTPTALSTCKLVCTAHAGRFYYDRVCLVEKDWVTLPTKLGSHI